MLFAFSHVKLKSASDCLEFVELSHCVHGPQNIIYLFIFGDFSSLQNQLFAIIEQEICEKF